MAKIETFFNHPHINLTASVGEGGVNLKDDVMIVQAMLKYALDVRLYFSKMQFPEPTGTICPQTVKIIREYQRFIRKVERASVSVDGVIDRAVGERAFGRRGTWTILSLNANVLEMRLFKGGVGNEFQELCRQFPQLNSVIDVPVGDLNLTLESSRNAGTLNLALE